MTDPVLDGIVKELQNTSAKTWGYSQTNSLALRMSLKRAFGDSQAKPSSPATTGTPAVQEASLGSASTETPVVHADKKMDLEAELEAFKKRDLEAAAEPASKRCKVAFQNTAALLECLYPLVDSRWFVLGATMGSWAKMPEKDLEYDSETKKIYLNIGDADSEKVWKDVLQKQETSMYITTNNCTSKRMQKQTHNAGDREQRSVHWRDHGI